MFSECIVNPLYIIGFAYLLGAVPWGIVLTRLFTVEDIREKGSGNIGATNVLRVAGKPLGILTLILDVSKGAVPVYISGTVCNGSGIEREFLMVLVTFAAISGHLFPVFLKFKGGKGVATAAGCFLVLSPISLMIVFVIFFGIVALTNRVSAGSISAAAALPATVFFSSGSWVFTGGALLISLIVIIAHRENIKRLVTGTEPEFRRRRNH